MNLTRTFSARFCAAAFASTFALGASAFAVETMGSRVEIKAEAVLSPSFGFDDNDQVSVVVHGDLPSACYTLADHTVERTPGTNHMRIRQFATLRSDGFCGLDNGTPGRGMPEHMLMTIPFNTDVSVGQLPVGDYQFEIDSRQPAPMRSLTVSKADSATVDSLPYALVSSAFSPDVFESTADVNVTLSGTLNSSCTKLADEVQVKKVNDVFVVLPTIKVIPNVICAQAMIPFERQVKLGKQAPGRYLVHVRSMNGRSVNKVIEVQ